MLSCVGFGAFKIGRNVGIKYERGYELPSDDESDRLLHAVVDELGVNYIDTAPAYGLSEERVGRALGGRSDVIISTKVGEVFEHRTSYFDFSDQAVRDSLARSREWMRRDVLDLVLVHSQGDDLHVLERTDVIAALTSARQRGEVKFIGFSGKTLDGSRAALAWADAIMVEYHLNDRSHAPVIDEAAAQGVGVIVKKGLASGRLPPRDGIRFVLGNPGVTSMVIGGLNIDHMRENIAHTTSTG
jgi:aryl-alcohol dehydrogenase-like predicted oxidoreductase